jgi:hypothetical protein
VSEPLDAETRIDLARRRAWVAFPVTLLLLGILTWQITDVWRGSGLDDQGDRILVMVSLDGAKLPQHTVVTHARVDVNGDLELVFLVQGHGLKRDPWRAVPASLRVVFASTPLSGEPITCRGGAVQPAVVRFDGLTEEDQGAVRADLIAGRGSALAYDSAGRNLGPMASADASETEAAPVPEGPQPGEFEYRQFDQAVTLVTTEDDYSRRTQTGKVTWAESCTIPAQYVWRTSKPSLYEQAARRSLFMPQLYFVQGAAQGKPDDLLMADLIVDRPLGYDLVASYPTVATRSSAWDLDLQISANYDPYLLSTDQPVVILEDRKSVGRREIVLLGYGAIAGAIGTALTLGTRSVLDVRETRRASARENG